MQEGRHATAAKLFAGAFAADASLAGDPKTGNRYQAARAAALAGCGIGKDEPAPDPAARAKLRKQALEWLRAELSIRDAQLRGVPVPPTLQSLEIWKTELDLAYVRDPIGLAKLPESERDDWKILWNTVDQILERSRATAPR